MSRTIFVVLAAFVATVFAQVQVNTPTSVQACLPVQLTWSGGKAPYFVGLIAGGQPSSPVLKDFGQQTGNSLTWNVDMPAGSAYTVQIRDSDGQLNYSDQFTIQQSSQTCPTSGGNSTAATSPAATTPATNGTAATTTPSTNTTTSTPGSKAGSISNSTQSKTSTSYPVSSSSNTTASSAKTSGASRITSGFAVIVVSVAVACLA